MKEKLISFVTNLKSKIHIDSYDEQATKQAIVLRILSTVGWDIFDTNEVYPEFIIKSQRVDYSLRINNKDKAFIEVKRIREELESHQEQLLRYSFEAGVSMAILTNGIGWWFYLPLLRDVAWEERKFYTVDLLQQEPEDVANKFIYLLSRDNILSGKAIENANSIYESQQKKNVIRKTLIKAWNKIVSDPEELLLDLLAGTTEKLCGHTVDIASAKRFISQNIEHLMLSEKPFNKSDTVSHKPIFRANTGLINKSQSALCLAYLKELNPEIKKENIKLLIEIDEMHKHIFEVDWNHHGKELLVIDKSGIHKKPSNAAQEVFGKNLLPNYSNIARKMGTFVDISKSPIQVIIRYVEVKNTSEILKRIEFPLIRMM